MKKKFLYATMAVMLFTGASFLTSCDDDDDNEMPPGNAVISIENVATKYDFVQSGTFRGTGDGLIMPGQSVQITFNAARGQNLTFATMYGYSNDLFFAPENPGLELFNDDGNAITGDVSEHIRLWDNGTRINQAPGANVTHPGTAEAENVTMVRDRDAQNNTYLAASRLMRLILEYSSANSQFTLTITNTSTGTANETPFSPGVWAVANRLGDDRVNEKPFYAAGEKSSAALTALAEMGNNATIASWATERTGIMTTLSRGIVVVYTGETNPLFTLNQKDGALGLKELAQKGNPQPLKESLERLRYVRHVYIIGNDPIAPGASFETTFEARQGDNIAYATMFGYSNDWFYANNTTIPSLTKGDVTSKTSLFDSGTGVNQYPGAGNSQAAFGGTPVPEDRVITTVTNNPYPVPETYKVIKVVLR